MKVKNLFVMCLAALSLVACSNDDDVVVPQTSDVVINLASTKATTKAPSEEMSLASLAAEKAITTGKLYVFENLENNTERYISSVDITGTSVTIPKLTVGNTYNFVAAVGVNTIVATTKEDLRKEVIELSTSKDAGSFIMYGESAESLKVEEKAANSLDVEVKRVLSGIQLVSITTDFKETVPEYARKGKAVVTSLELLDTNPTSQLDGTVIEVESGKIKGLGANFGTTGIEFTKKENDTEPTYINVTDNSVRAYCCPGKIKYVVLYVTYTYKDVDYKRAYNVTTLSNELTFPDGLSANYLYGLKVTLTGAGSDDGGKPDTFAEAKASLSVADWSDGTVIDVNDQEN